MVDSNLPFALQQQHRAGRIVDLTRGFYVIIPEELSLANRLPGDRYIDDLMNSHQVPYYVGLLTAAFYYSSAHQRPRVRSVHLSFKDWGISLNDLITGLECAKWVLYPLAGMCFTHAWSRRSEEPISHARTVEADIKYPN